MYILNEDDMWVSLYKNRLGFLYKSIDEYISIYGNEKLDNYVKENYSVYLNTSVVDLYTSVIRIINGNVQYRNNLLDKEYDSKLDINENKYISEINLQSKIMENLNSHKTKKYKFEKTMSDENIKLLNGIEKIYNHFIDTIERLELQGLENVYNRKVIKIIELLQCFKQNLYNYFINRISSFVSLSSNLNINDLVLNNIVDELDKVEGGITKYIFEKYINELEWIAIIERVERIALEFIDILKRYELEICINIKSNIIESIRNENERLKVSLKNIESITEERRLIEKKLDICELMENEFEKGNDEYNNNINNFNEIIGYNFVSEYNKVINIINNEVHANSKLVTHFEYLYLITSEMNNMEEIIYG